MRPIKSANEGRIAGLPADFELTLACGQCESCRAIHPDAPQSSSHPDLHIITKELIRYHDRGGTSKGTTLSIAVIRGEITGDTEAGKEAKIYKRSFRGRGKWFIIDEAELMQVEAQNALLKTLEEPPAESYLVLITTSPLELLSTIRSRSQIVEFGELPAEVIRAALQARGILGPDAAILTRLAHGSLGRALGFAQDIATIEQRNAKDAARSGKSDEADDDDEKESKTQLAPGGVLAWTRALAGRLDELVVGQCGASDVAGVIQDAAGQFARLALFADPLASKDQATRNGAALMLGIAADWFDDRLRESVGVPMENVLPAKTAGLEPGQVRALIRAAREAEGQLDMNANVGLLLSALTTGWEAILRGGVAVG